MVAAANPLATEAGFRILREGGSALDAAIAVQMVLALVEPQSSGIGGGAMLMHSSGQTVQAWDGRETAPAAADERMFLAANGRPVPYSDAVIGGRAVATPPEEVLTPRTTGACEPHAPATKSTLAGALLRPLEAVATTVMR